MELEVELVYIVTCDGPTAVYLDVAITRAPTRPANALELASRRRVCAELRTLTKQDRARRR